MQDKTFEQLVQGDWLFVVTADNIVFLKIRNIINDNKQK